MEDEREKDRPATFIDFSNECRKKPSGRKKQRSCILPSAKGKKLAIVGKGRWVHHYLDRGSDYEVGLPTKMMKLLTES